MMERSRNYADPAQTTYIEAGVLRFGIEYRRLQNDQGICIHVFGGPNDQQDEVLRFDGFEREPHYHYAWSKNDRYVPLDTAAEGERAKTWGEFRHRWCYRCVGSLQESLRNQWVANLQQHIWHTTLSISSTMRRAGPPPGASHPRWRRSR